jgi:hypothetical protein
MTKEAQNITLKKQVFAESYSFETHVYFKTNNIRENIKAI